MPEGQTGGEKATQSKVNRFSQLPAGNPAAVLPVHWTGIHFPRLRFAYPWQGEPFCCVAGTKKADFAEYFCFSYSIFWIVVV